MERKQRHYIALFAFLTTALFNFSCSDDRAEELTSIDYERLFSPIKIEAFVINRTDARLNWTLNKDVESYSLELFADDSLTFAGSPVKTFSDVTGDQLPYYIRDLDGETHYSVRIKSVAAGKTESKWSDVTFKTGTENIFLPFQDGDVEATAVTLRWIPGRTLTSINIEPGGISHQVTAGEIAAGSATIEGLTGETNYTVTLKNGAKTRGILEFMTLVDIGNAIAVHPEDDLLALLAAANDGDAFALFPGTYGAGDMFVVNKTIEIKGVYPYNKPVLNGYISLEEGAGLLLKDVTLDGGALQGQSIVFNTAGVTYKALTVEGCEIRDYVKGVYYLNVASLVESITYHNNLIYNIQCDGGDFMDSRKGAFNSLTLTYNTIYNSAAGRDLIRYDDASGSFPGMTSTILVDHNTLHGVCNSSSKRLLYVRFKENKITFTNNIVAETSCIFTNQSNTDPSPTFGGNNYFNAPNLFSASGSSSKFFDDSADSEDPGFVDAANGNFTITNELLKAKGTGDPRWVN
ncbi:MAG: DUF4957 domain-containing protein [Proteiniphilum sp.]|nr:DUF4957 domain-containing protein [Proteiniphilum sp.]MDD3555498.1 DUF4957 domain-containing protein [Proteiniphilum sp.]MDD4485698.1 DUF4957 domain-containing protein [Proteiniphilum sp.]